MTPLAGSPAGGDDSTSPTSENDSAATADDRPTDEVSPSTKPLSPPLPSKPPPPSPDSIIGDSDGGSIVGRDFDDNAFSAASAASAAAAASSGVGRIESSAGAVDAAVRAYEDEEARNCGRPKRAFGAMRMAELFKQNIAHSKKKKKKKKSKNAPSGPHLKRPNVRTAHAVNLYAEQQFQFAGRLCARRGFSPCADLSFPLHSLEPGLLRWVLSAIAAAK